MLGCNMFCYCLNNPVNMTDESGCVPKWLETIWKYTKKAIKGVALLGNDVAKTIHSVISSVGRAETVAGIVSDEVDFACTIGNINYELELHTLNVLGYARMGESYTFNDFCRKDEYIQNVKNAASNLKGISPYDSKLESILCTKNTLAPNDVLYVNKEYPYVISNGRGILAVKIGSRLTEKGVKLLRTAWSLVA